MQAAGGMEHKASRRSRQQLRSASAAALLIAALVASLGASPCSAAWQRYSAITFGAHWQLQQPDAAAFVLDPVTLHKGVMNMGERALYQRAMCEILNETSAVPVSGRCLNVVALGGSFTVGASLDTNSVDSPQGKQDAWPLALERMLNAAYPRTGCNHTVLNLGQSSASTAWHIERLSEPDRSAQLAKADLVVVDTALNDVEELHMGQVLSKGGSVERPENVSQSFKDHEVARHTEVLINQLLALTNRPMPLWVGVSTRLRENYNLAVWPRTSDAVHAHLPATRHWGVPHISLMDAIGPFNTPERDAWLRETYLTDLCCHGSKQAQVMVATYIMYLFSVFQATCKLHPQPSAWELSYAPRKPMYATQAVLDAYTNSKPLHVHTSQDQDKPYRTASYGWVAMEDVKGKPGYIATAVGANVTYTLPASVVRDHVRFGILHIVHLKSYAHMGVMEVAVAALPGPGADQVPLAEAVVDTLWVNKVSEPRVAELRWTPEDVPPGSSLQVRVAVVAPRASDPPREEHKVKLVELVLY